MLNLPVAPVQCALAAIKLIASWQAMLARIEISLAFNLSRSQRLLSLIQLLRSHRFDDVAG